VRKAGLRGGEPCSRRAARPQKHSAEGSSISMLLINCISGFSHIISSRILVSPHFCDVLVAPLLLRVSWLRLSLHTLWTNLFICILYTLVPPNNPAGAFCIYQIPPHLSIDWNLRDMGRKEPPSDVLPCSPRAELV
jgi:hypothetical protein